MKAKVKESKRVMRLIVPHIGLFECRVCERTHTGLLGTGGRWKRGTWQCRNGCTFPVKESKIQRILPDGKRKTVRMEQQESPFTTEVTDLFCKCKSNSAYGHPFNLIVGSYYQVQKTTYHNTMTGKYTADYLTTVGNLGGSKLFKMLFEEVPVEEFRKAKIQQRFDL